LAEYLAANPFPVMNPCLTARSPAGNSEEVIADPTTGEIRRFLVGCRGQEVTGCIASADNRTRFINLQHPRSGSESNPLLPSRWPDGGDARPRSAVVVVTRADGGAVGG
jgi:uncharacterized protein